MTHIDVKSFGDRKACVRIVMPSYGNLVVMSGRSSAVSTANPIFAGRRKSRRTATAISSVTRGAAGRSNWTKHKVRTHRERWDFCRSYPNDVYCKVDPEGDALTRPFNCGNHYCTAGDCQWHFEQSNAYDTCQGEDGNSEPIYNISATDGSSQACRIEASCKTGEDTWANRTLLAEVWDVDDIKNCKHGWFYVFWQ